MKIEIGITETNRQAVATELTKILADENILYMKTKNAHWNIQGPDFHEKHLFFEEQFGQLYEVLESVADRIHTLGHFSSVTCKSFLCLTHFTEKTSEKNNSQGFIKELLEDHESLIIILREHIKSFADEFHDAGTSDFITGFMKTHENMTWCLRSHITN